MADTQPREVDSKIAKEMGEYILFKIEGKEAGQISREDYLRAVYQSVLALKGFDPR